MPIAVSRPRSPSPDSQDGPIKKAKIEPQHPTPGPPEADLAKLIREQMDTPLQYQKKYQHELDYRDKLVLAPMVRTGSLPMRLLSLYYGAGLVWSPEVIDKAIIGSERKVDPVTGVITYTKGQGPIFSTHPVEKPYLIFQIGSSNPELAVKAAQTVQQDVSGIDLNCGCPKSFSTHSGMGAALLSTPDILLNILRSLLDQIELPISCKIRLLPTQQDTLYLASRILQTGLRNLTVHCRTRDMRPGEKAIWDRLGDIVKLGNERGIPVICNGDGDGYPNLKTIKDLTNADSIMLARAAERNPSVFQPDGLKCNVKEIIPRLLKITHWIDNPWGNTKFLLTQFKPNFPTLMNKAEKRDIQEAINKSKSVVEVAEKMKIDLEGGKEFILELAETLAQREKETSSREEFIDELAARPKEDEPVQVAGA